MCCHNSVHDEQVRLKSDQSLDSFEKDIMEADKLDKGNVVPFAKKASLNSRSVNAQKTDLNKVVPEETLANKGFSLALGCAGTAVSKPDHHLLAQPKDYLDVEPVNAT